MLKQFPLTELVKAVKAKIEANTDMKCYDVVPVDAVSPFSYAQVVSVEPADTKTMFCKKIRYMGPRYSRRSKIFCATL